MAALVMFPQRVKFVNADGTLTADAIRMFSTLSVRVGGTVAPTNTELEAALLAATAALRAAQMSLAGAGFAQDAGGDIEFIPGPQGPQGQQGPAGPAVFLLQEPEDNDVFWRV